MLYASRCIVVHTSPLLTLSLLSLPFLWVAGPRFGLLSEEVQGPSVVTKRERGTGRGRDVAALSGRDDRKEVEIASRSTRWDETGRRSELGIYTFCWRSEDVLRGGCRFFRWQVLGESANAMCVCVDA